MEETYTIFTSSPLLINLPLLGFFDKTLSKKFRSNSLSLAYLYISKNRVMCNVNTKLSSLEIIYQPKKVGSMCIRTQQKNFRTVQDILRTENLLNHFLQLDTIPLHIVHPNCDLTNERVRLLLFVKSCSSLNRGGVYSKI